MIPGTTSKFSEKGPVTSAATLHVDTDIIYLTGTTAITTLIPHFGGGFSGSVVLIPTGGNIATVAISGTVGNITVAVTMPDLRATWLVYSRANAKWYPGAIS